MFRFIEAEQQTMQSGTKEAYYSLRIFTSSPSDCDKTFSSSFFYLSDRILTRSSVCDNHSEFWVLKWLMPVAEPTWTFSETLKSISRLPFCFLRIFSTSERICTYSSHSLPGPGGGLLHSGNKNGFFNKGNYIYMHTHIYIYILTSELWFCSNLTEPQYNLSFKYIYMANKTIFTVINIPWYDR